MGVFEALSDWNPWWFKKDDLLDELAGIERHDYRQVIDSIELKEITVLTGVRRCGKSTLMYQMIRKLINKGINPKSILFINFEDQSLNTLSLDEIYLEYRQKMNPNEKAFIFLDEIQKKEEWGQWIRKKYDQKSDAKFVVSGSASKLLKKEFSTLLTGRIVAFEIMPLAFREFLEFSKIKLDLDLLKKGVINTNNKSIIQNALNKYLEHGGFPRIFFVEDEEKRLLLTNYFDDIIFKDISGRHNLKSQKPTELAKNLATNVTKSISLRGLRKATGLAYGQITEYLSYYKEAYLFFEINHFSYSLKEQKTRPSKIYCIDNGMRNVVAFKFSEDTGKLAENIVFLELKRQNKEIYYWKGTNEIDFVIKNMNNSLDAINVTYTDEINTRETKGLEEFKQQNKKVNQLIITKNTEKIENGVKYVPLWKWLLEK